MRLLLGRQVLHRGGEHGAGHPRCVLVEEGEELAATDGPEDGAGGLLDQVLGVLDELFRDRECGRGLAVADEVERGLERGAALPEVR